MVAGAVLARGLATDRCGGLVAGGPNDERHGHLGFVQGAPVHPDRYVQAIFVSVITAAADLELLVKGAFEIVDLDVLGGRRGGPGVATERGRRSQRCGREEGEYHD